MKARKFIQLMTRKQPIYNTEGYPSHSSDIIFALHMETLTEIMPSKILNPKDKSRILKASRAPLHICLN